MSSLPHPAIYDQFTHEIEEFEPSIQSTTTRRPVPPQNLGLTQLHRNVLVAFCHGETVEEVAQLLATDPRRIRFILETIAHLLGVRTIHRMLAVCIAKKWIDPHI